MSKRKANKSLEGPFVTHSLTMLISPAWRALSINERRLLERLEIEHMNHGGSRNGRLMCTYADFIAMGIGGNQRVRDAIASCEALGFIEVQRHGWANRPNRKAPNTYRLTYLGSRAETTVGGYHPAVSPTNEWQRFKTHEEIDAALAQAAIAKDRADSRPPPLDIESAPPARQLLHTPHATEEVAR